MAYVTISGAAGKGTRNDPVGGVGGLTKSELKKVIKAGVKFASLSFETGVANREKYIVANGTDAKVYKMRVPGTGVGNEASDGKARSWLGKVIKTVADETAAAKASAKAAAAKIAADQAAAVAAARTSDAAAARAAKKKVVMAAMEKKRAAEAAQKAAQTAATLAAQDAAEAAKVKADSAAAQAALQAEIDKLKTEKAAAENAVVTAASTTTSATAEVEAASKDALAAGVPASEVAEAKGGMGTGAKVLLGAAALGGLWMLMRRKAS